MVTCSLRVAKAWFSALPVADGITLVTEPNVAPLIRSNFYHVQGTEADLIVDTGTGVASLASALSELIGIPKRVIAVATHAHYDHVGGMHEFEERLVHPEEKEALAGRGQFASLLTKDLPPAWRAQVEADGFPLPDVLLDARPYRNYDPRQYALKPAVATRLVNEGDVISLGNRVFEVMHTPGHSPGGICLYEAQTGTLFSGDTVYDSRLFDELPGSNIRSYIKTTKRLRSLAGVRMVCAATTSASTGPGSENYVMHTLASAAEAIMPVTCQLWVASALARKAAIMGSSSGNQHSYTADNASLYSTLGIEGTTYEIGFDATRELLGDINGKTLLDFGCGTGRSTSFLKALGAEHVYGVDHDRHMIDKALSRDLDGVTFMYIHDIIPLPDASVDGAVSLNVFVEIRTLGEMTGICIEIARTLRPRSLFIMESSSPMAFGHTFRSYSYPSTERLKSGDCTSCIVTTPSGQLVIEDTFWTEDDYVTALTQAGLTVVAIDYPRPRDPSAWSTDEASVPPCIVIKAMKSST
jgi:glyoxylase-like metal-dependent hydrolase (beta-lactamase superfamily II)/SAM-dependent methyltransferase